MVGDTPTYNILEGVLAQEQYCGEKQLPRFAPADSICPHCGFSIYGKNGYSVEFASTHHITGCPYCRKSFLD